MKYSVLLVGALLLSGPTNLFGYPATDEPDILATHDQCIIPIPDASNAKSLDSHTSGSNSDLPQLNEGIESLENDIQELRKGIQELEQAPALLRATYREMWEKIDKRRAKERKIQFCMYITVAVSTIVSGAIWAFGGSDDSSATTGMSSSSSSLFDNNTLFMTTNS